MIAPLLTSVVEGHGETAALPVLMRRIASEFIGLDVQCRRPHRLPRAQIVEAGKAAAAVRVQSAVVSDKGGVVVLVDADDDCAVTLVTRIRARLDHDQARTAVVVAVREYECWLLAALPSLAGRSIVRPDATYDGDPEQVGAAKERLSSQCSVPYSPTLHQAALTALADLNMMHDRCRSFRKLVDELTRLCR